MPEQTQGIPWRGLGIALVVGVVVSFLSPVLGILLFLFLGFAWAIGIILVLLGNPSGRRVLLFVIALTVGIVLGLLLYAWLASVVP